jgi:cell division protein FtsI (penicillin-binding protein 3)
MGFANDKEHKYSIGVVVIKPLKNHFASSTAVPIFKKAVDIMVEEGYLLPSDPKIVK